MFESYYCEVIVINGMDVSDTEKLANNMNNVEKGKELVQKYKFGNSISPIVNDRMYDAILEMAEWKDKQLKETKDAFIAFCYNIINGMYVSVEDAAKEQLEYFED